MRRDGGICLLLVVVSCLVPLASCRFPGTVPETVKIGLSAPFEGLYRDLGYEALYAVRLAVRRANEAGGVGGGFLVELVAVNDFNDPPEAVLQAREMAADPGILGVIGGLSPRTAAAAAPEYERLGLAFVAPFAEPGEVGRAAGAAAAGRLGARSAAILHQEDAAAMAQVEGFSEAFAGEGGQVIGRACPGEFADFADLLAGLGSAPDLAFLASDTSRAAEWIAGLRGAGFAGTLLGGPEVGSALTVDLAGPAGDGVYFVSTYRAVPEDGGFREGYEALSGGVAPGGVAAWSYEATRGLLQAMDEALRSGAESMRAATGAAVAEWRPGGWPLDLYVIRGGAFLPAAESR